MTEGIAAASPAAVAIKASEIPGATTASVTDPIRPKLLIIWIRLISCESTEQYSDCYSDTRCTSTLYSLDSS
jgi:hypothetical protein